MKTPLETWVEEQARLTKPDKIHWCDGSEEEARRLVEVGIKQEKIEGQLLNRDEAAAYLHLSHPTGEKSARTVASPDGLLIVDYAASGRPLGVEITAPQAVPLDRLNQLFFLL